MVRSIRERICMHINKYRFKIIFQLRTLCFLLFPFKRNKERGRINGALNLAILLDLYLSICMNNVLVVFVGLMGGSLQYSLYYFL